MRAVRGGLHISGAERIVREGDIKRAASELLDRARGHERGVPDSITITVDSLEGRRILRLKALPVRDIDCKARDGGRECAVSELVKAGVTEEAARRAMDALTAVPVNMTGAMVIDAATGKRLDEPVKSGIRARAMDHDESFMPALKDALNARGLCNIHLLEALALATKVAHAPGAVAELCISDDPGYITGYVASRKGGYVRITPLKDKGDPVGGRAFFVDGAAFDASAYVEYLRDTPVLVVGQEYVQ